MIYKNLKTEKIFIIAVLSGLLIAIVWHAFLGYILHFNYPWNTFLFSPEARFSDFTDVFKLTLNRQPYLENADGFLSNYFPLTYLFFIVFNLIGNINAALLIFQVLFVFLACFGIFLLNKEKELKLQFIIPSFFLSYPFIFCLDRANIESYLFICLLFFLLFFYNKQYFLSSIFLAIAISMKLYPGVFIILFLVKKQYKHIFLTSLQVAVLSILSILVFKGGFVENIKGLSAGLSWFNKSYIFDALGIPYGSSLYSIFRALIGVLGNDKDFLLIFNRVYSIGCLISFLLISVLIIKRKCSDWKALMLLTNIMILFPYVSFDYKLISLFIPLFFFIKDNQVINERVNLFYLVCFILLFIPKNYLFVMDTVSIQVILNPIIMISMSIVLLVDVSKGER